MAPGGKGCAFMLKSKAGKNIDLNFGIAMKTCPNSDMCVRESERASARER
jgi:hypothetical protein